MPATFNDTQNRSCAQLFVIVNRPAPRGHPKYVFYRRLKIQLDSRPTAAHLLRALEIYTYDCSLRTYNVVGGFVSEHTHYWTMIVKHDGAALHVDSLSAPLHY